jgi:hypothetical protein
MENKKVFYVKAVDDDGCATNKYFIAANKKEVENSFSKKFKSLTLTCCKAISISPRLVKEYIEIYGKKKGE